MPDLSFFVAGHAAPQGSKTAWGTEANPRTRPWRALISMAAQHECRIAKHTIIQTPVMVTLLFVFDRPRAHFGTGKNAGTLKPNAPDVCDKESDLDKLQRATFDAMSKIVYRDDKQVVGVNARKVYTTPINPRPGVHITVIWDCEACR